MFFEKNGEPPLTSIGGATGQPVKRLREANAQLRPRPDA